MKLLPAACCYAWQELTWIEGNFFFQVLMPVKTRNTIMVTNARLPCEICLTSSWKLYRSNLCIVT